MRNVTLEEKEIIKSGIASGKTYRELGEELGIKERTVRKWGQKIKRGEDLSPPKGRPAIGLLGSFTPKIKELIDEYRPEKKRKRLGSSHNSRRTKT